MKKEYNLFLDDERSPKDVTWIELPNVIWIVVRNYNEFVKIINEQGIPQYCSFDHDIDQSSYKEFYRAHGSDKTINYNNIKELTGVDCAKYLAQYCLDKHVPLPVYYVHSMNYMGAGNIVSVMESAKKVINGT
jgi:hypothetical protein